MADLCCRITFMSQRAVSSADRNLKFGESQEIIKTQKPFNSLQSSVCICVYILAHTCTCSDDLWGFHTKLNF